jgi:hypothetical protein
MERHCGVSGKVLWRVCHLDQVAHVHVLGVLARGLGLLVFFRVGKRRDGVATLSVLRVVVLL